MGEKLPPFEMALYHRTDEILHYIWDPIGVAGEPFARDEYHGYLPRTFALLTTSDAIAESIASYLGEVSTQRMGLSADSARDLKVAQLLIDIKTELEEKFDRR